MNAKNQNEVAQDALEFEYDLSEPPEKVWRALTVPELLAAWMMPNDIRPQAGSRFAFAGPEAPIECEILDAEPERLLRYSWREQPGDATRQDPLDSTVTFTLARTVSGGTHLRIVHDGFARKAMPAVAMAGAGCRLSLGLHEAGKPIAANTPRLLLRAA
ncbi:SRPBCC domain-containing protein [Mesorhizobium sp. B283B1A]|uniref:Activator of Hsp90 ATPase 1 family protein n=1 Tax=Mesorhizobium opportunistum (strain LMG 24607 / HAMBI 3007 / WSM2075) TaxID=536019 RepID=F7Y762_MESOW|nr:MULTISPECIES: SRPBCC domain-containing protein [Mesorhizobium]AEH88612.1 Activator of Hsp90 ATPase 1 family protein [Mesorhizobium opportunistum WSM2075]MCA0030749.1 SRPBCC domain-containing protein [Mesorhizobium sp. B263B2A]MCA0049129.1 SRPBCC domain-containing protein [Mesorhizobium sp. B283B1A]UQS62452.1 SRPBCC domain-containing protein [Mesorhizobium opportunistum]